MNLAPRRILLFCV